MHSWGDSEAPVLCFVDVSHDSVIAHERDALSRGFRVVVVIDIQVLPANDDESEEIETHTKNVKEKQTR